jgi:hypothetical protein
MHLALQLKASRGNNPPQVIQIDNHFFQREKVFKHDFFAVTALYQHRPPQQSIEESSNPLPQKIILKWSRSTDFLGLPLAWLGRWISHRERTILKHLQPLPSVPRLIGPYQSHGLLYEYIEGVSLDSRPDIPEMFFDQLQQILTDIHARNIAYLDLNKKGNILLGKDNKPHLIDFQISWHHANPLWPFRSLQKKILQRLQQEDLYHLRKQKRRFRPDLMTPTQIKDSRKISPIIWLHRKTTRPFILLRRRLFAWLLKKGRLITDDVTEYHSETDPKRWSKK